MKPPLTGLVAPECKTRRVFSAVVLLLSFLFVSVILSRAPPDSDKRSNLRLQDTATSIYSLNDFSIRNLQDNGNCTLECCGQFQTDLCTCTTTSESSWIDAVPNAVQWILIIFLVCMSAMFSGLTLGLLSLDKTGLEILMAGEDAKNAAAAKRIYPIRERGNLLLCTLLLGNVAVNAMLSILMADKAGGLIGFLSSTFVIVIFGEIIPQAVCARYALEIGSRFIPVVKVIMVLFLPVSWPLAFCLDKALGDELATTYSSAEMHKLLQIHVAEGRFDQETAVAMTGALNFKDVKVKQVMTPIDKTFMLNVDERLNFDCIATIFKTGYSRIPVYEIDRNNIIGILFTKDLIFVDPEDETPIRNFISIFGRGAHLVWPDDSLGDVLRELKQGRSHLAIVRDVNNRDETQDPYYEIVGIITLEDIIEEILGDEIVDETDAFVDHTQSVRVDRLESFDWGRLRLLDSKIVDETLSYEETKAVVAHLRTNYSDAVSLLSNHQLFRLVSETSVSELPSAEQKVGSDVPEDLMYEEGKPTDICTLILSGRVTVLAGADRFRSDVSSWTVLASSALTIPSYVPDFTAFVSSGPCRCLQFTRQDYVAAVDASALEKRSHHESQELAEPQESSDSVDTKPTIVQPKAPVPGPNPDTDKTRATQERRSKLIAAFRKAGKRTEDQKRVNGVEKEENLSQNDVRKRSVRFRSASDRAVSPVIDEAQDHQTDTASHRSAFEYIGASSKTLDGSDGDEEKE